MSDDAELKRLRSEAAALLLRYRKLLRAQPPALTQEQVANRLGITRHEVRVHEQRGLLKARRAALRLLAAAEIPQVRARGERDEF